MNIWKMSTIALAGTLAAVVGTGAIHTASADPQPRMDEALVKLQEAKGWLERAVDDKGGHRVKAIAKVQEAIDETREGIRFANAHR